MLTKTVLGLVLFVCQPAQQLLETGCKYPRNVSVEKHVLYDDLKCTYLFGGLTQMLVTKRLTESPFSWRTTLAVSRMMPYGRIVKCHIETLYRLKVKRMDSLWVLHLYFSMLNGFLEKSLKKDKDGRQILATHGYVIAQLRKDLTGCRKDNAYNNEMDVFSNRNPPESRLVSLMSTNVDRAKELFTKNNIFINQSFAEYDGQMIKIGHLLMNNIGSKYYFIEDLMGIFNVQVDWSGASIRLDKSWHDAHYILNWSNDKLENIKTYYQLVFNFLKIIICRLTLKHIKYLEQFAITALFVNYAKIWYDMVQQFSVILRLTEDLHVKDLLSSLDKLVKSEEKTDRVVKTITQILETLCLPLGCDATKKINLNGEEFGAPFKRSILNEVNDLNITKSPVLIEYHSLENTRAFLYYLKWVFKYVDFDLVRLLVDYINEIK